MTDPSLLASAETLEQEIKERVGKVGGYHARRMLLQSADTLSRLRAVLGESQNVMENVRRFSASKARQFSEQAFGDSRVEDAANVLEDISLMLRDAQVRASSPSSARSQE
jgi:hypothetical protein